MNCKYTDKMVCADQNCKQCPVNDAIQNDRNRIVEELEDLKVYENYTIYLMKNLAFDETIEIVKAGVVDADNN